MLQTFKLKDSIIIYDEAPDIHQTIELINLGVNGYISSGDSLEEFKDCVEAVSKNKNYISQNVFRMILHNETPFMHPIAKLSFREQQIAQFLTDGKKVSEIAVMLKRRPSTISSVKSSVFKKLKINSLIELYRLMRKLPGDRN
jgi:DNA-binding NarL/FixJ family response regulator